MNEDSRKNIPSESEIQKIEINEEQLKKVTGGMLMGIMPNPYNRRCAVNPNHAYFAYNSEDVCPICGAKEYIEISD